MSMEEQPLQGLTIAVPENRQSTLMLNLLTSRGATVRPVPLVAIHDAPDSQPVLNWLRDFVDEPPALFILLTGEGLRRLLALAEREGLKDAFIEVLGRVSKLCRGPKPIRALREIGLKAELEPATPTTEGIIVSLFGENLAGQKVAVQLYGQDPNSRLVNFLRSKQAVVHTVAPYIYADEAEENQVLELIDSMYAGNIDVLALTSASQFRRLLEIARRGHRENELKKGMQITRIAVVGPVLRDLLTEEGFKVDIMPERSYFMKPLVTAIVDCFKN